MTDYLVIEAAADNINVAHTPVWSVPPYSVCSFLRAFQERMNSRCKSNRFYVEGFSVAQHGLQGHGGMLAGAGVQVMHKRAMVTEKNVDNHALYHRLPYKLLASGRFTIIAEVEFEDEIYMDESALEKDALAVLSGLKFLGGIITDRRFAGPFSTEHELKKHLDQTAAPGLLYKSNDKALQDQLQKGYSPAEALLRSTHLIIDRNTEKPVNSPGLNFASLVGYQLLENPAERSGLRYGHHKHAYAEPVFSVIERVPLSRYTRNGKSLEDMEVLWRKKFDKESNTLYVSNQ